MARADRQPAPRSEQTDCGIFIDPHDCWCEASCDPFYPTLFPRIGGLRWATLIGRCNTSDAWLSSLNANAAVSLIKSGHTSKKSSHSSKNYFLTKNIKQPTSSSPPPPVHTFHRPISARSSLYHRILFFLFVRFLHPRHGLRSGSNTLLKSPRSSQIAPHPLSEIETYTTNTRA